MSTSVIDFSKYANADASGKQIDFSKYATGTPTAQSTEPQPSSPSLLTRMATQPSQFSHLNPLRYAEELGQGMAQGVQMLEHPINTAKQIYQIATTPVVHDPSGDVPLAQGLGKTADILAQTYGQAVPAAVTGAALKGVGTVANRVIPSTTRAGAGLSALTDSPEGAFAQRPVETPNALATARKIESELQVTGEKPHPIIQHYMAGEDLRSTPPEIVNEMKAQGVDPTQPMTMYDARTMLKRVNDIIRNSSGFGSDAQAKTAITNLKRFAGALDQDISANAERMGFGKDYAAMRNEYKRGQQTIRASEDIGAPAGMLAGYTLGREIGEPLGGTMIGGMVGRHLGKYTTGAVARAIVERNAGPPRLSSLPPTREAYTRTLLDAKEGLKTPQQANAEIQRSGGSVKVNPIDRSNIVPTRSPQAAESATSTASESARDAKVNEFFKQAAMRATQEAAGADVLDQMAARGESPIDLNNRFWDQTFNRLPPEVQKRFTNYLKKETGGMQPGDTIGIRADKTPIVAQSWGDIAKNILDLSHNADNLEGTTRGLVALMKIAEQKFPAAKLPAAKPTIRPLPSRPIPRPTD